MARDGNDDTDEREELDETDERPKKKKKKQKLPREHRHRPRWHWQLLGILMLVFGIAWCLPWVVAWTPLRQQIVGMALPNLDGSAQIGGASLGWFSSIELTDIQLHDRQGQPVLSIASITTERSLWRLALNRKEAGTIRVVRPEVQLVTWPDGSNLETMLRSMIKRPAKDTPRKPSAASFVVEVIDGKAALAELSQAPVVDGKSNAPPEAPRAAGTIEKMQAKITHVPSADPPLAMQLDARMVPAGLLPANIAAANSAPLVPGAPGTVHAEVTLKREEADGAASTVRGHVALKAAAAELGPLQPLVMRLAGPTRLGGIATTDLLIDWGHDAKGPTITAAGTADAQRLLLANATWLGHSIAQLDSVRLKPDVTYGNGQLTLRLCRVESDFGSVEANGTIDTVRLADANDAATISQAAGQDFELGGSIDIARLAERMPGLIPLRLDTRIESGRLAVSLRSRSEGRNRRWEGSLLASELVAVHAGKRLDFRRPIQLSVVAQAQPKGLPTGQLRCTSDYLTCQADGSPTDASASLEADLDRLAADLSQLVDLGGLQLAGHVRAGFEWRSTRPANALAPVGLNLATGQAPPAGQAGSISTLTADGHVMLDNLQIQWPGMRPWQEPRLSAALKLRGAASGRSVARVDEASLRIDSGSDHLVVTLREPVPGLAGASSLSTGQIARAIANIPWRVRWTSN
ncbi:MAG: hypothetical protein K8T25_20365 [Planctomycetia bacterium]|nr:hypothetical protein [Planctomycetia bacterium]